MLETLHSWNNFDGTVTNNAGAFKVNPYKTFGILPNITRSTHCVYCMARGEFGCQHRAQTCLPALCKTAVHEYPA